MPSILNATTSSGLVTSADNSGSLQLATNNGTTAVTITTAQNVGIGTTTPVNNSGYGGLTLNGTSGSLFSLMTNGTETGRVASLGNETSIQCQASTGYINFVQGTSGGTERARFDSSGNLLVNLTSTSGYSSITTPKTIINAGNNGGSNAILCGMALVNQANGGNSGYGVSIRFNNSASEAGKYSAIAGVGDSSFSNSTALAFFTNPNATNGADNVTQRMYISGGGSIGAPSGTNIYNASDERLKKNIVDLNAGLNTINALRPVTFNWQENFCKEENDKILYGFIAQETQTVDENLVESFGVGKAYYGDSENPTVIENPLRVNEKFIIPILVKAIQELNAKVDAQALEIQALKGVA
jgi:hypothetical protein